MPAIRCAWTAHAARHAITRLGALCACWLAVTATVGATTPPDLYAPASCEELQRAGWPDDQWRWAGPQMMCDYTGYFVGGGAPHRCGRCRCASEGTWGWDYHGRWFPRRVRLAWFCWPRCQGGEGRYAPDGPRVAEAVAEAVQPHRH